MHEHGISIIIPIFNQKNFLTRAIQSVIAQSFTNWEIIILNDGSTDLPESVVDRYLVKYRVRYYKHDANKGLGAALNLALSYANYDYIAYLPADDVYYTSHLKLLYDCLKKAKDAILAFSGVKFNYKDGSYTSGAHYAHGQIPSLSLQLVQVMHHRTSLKWTERTELVTDNLDIMYWSKLKTLGTFVGTNRISAEWVSHPNQRHRIINELQGGGLHKYKQFYGVTHLLRFHSSNGNLIDEFEQYKRFRNIKIKDNNEPLKILVVGELAYNPERMAAFEKQGHKLYGLWMQNPFFYNTTGPLPFGSVIDIPKENWKDHIKDIKPDIIYALLNHPAVPLAHEVLSNNPDVPFIWHFKESPFYCRQEGTWNQLLDLYQKADGKIFINEICKNWFEQSVYNIGPYHILDGDLPPGCYFKHNKSQLLSTIDNEPHTVISGRPFGLTPDDVSLLAKQKIHLHLYGEYNQKAYFYWIQQAKELSKGYLHLHPNCLPDDWTREFSKYDAGWLHCFKSSNYGDLMRADWLDMNLPARMSTYAAAGLPMIQRNNAMHLVASQAITKQMNIGIFFETYVELAKKLRDTDFMNSVKENAWNRRAHFSFDSHFNSLIAFFKQIKRGKKFNQ